MSKKSGNDPNQNRRHKVQVHITQEIGDILYNQYMFIAMIRDELDEIVPFQYALQKLEREGMPLSEESGTDSLKKLSYLALNIYIVANPKLGARITKGD